MWKRGYPESSWVNRLALGRGALPRSTGVRAHAFLLSEQQARIQAAARERGKWGVSRRCGRYVGVASVEQAAEARAS